jgi:dephospho-CoA kinase
VIAAPPFTDGRLRIGLTGGIASGKSTVARLFAQRGVPVIDMDQLAREVVAPGEPALAAIVSAFGEDMLGADGELDRARLRARVFHDLPSRKRLEELLHPQILSAAVRCAESLGGDYQVIVAPLLVEFGLSGWVDRVLVVDCPTEMQIRRLLARDVGDEALARAILAAQATREVRLEAADDVIVNDGPAERLPAAVARLDAAYRDMATHPDRPHPPLRFP